ncbi:MAG: sugar transferase [Saprospiraceae bacterium]|nr:sugar transferase [Saprospiraceae bacterium]
MKRFFDFFVALTAIVILSPLLIPIVIGLLLTGEHYVFYFQERVGYKNRVFDIWKFATMLKNSPNMTGGLITLKNDPRLTPMGGFLRKTKINELPQLFNVLIGDMSFVGPRPVMQKSFDQYPKDVQKVIYSVKPGLTGIGSIIFRDEEELITRQKELGNDPWEFYKNVIYPYKGKVEEWYQKHSSLKTDILILFLTVWAILLPKSELHYSVFKDIPKRPAQLS